MSAPYFQCPECARPPGACICGRAVLTLPEPFAHCPEPACHSLLTLGETCRCVSLRTRVRRALHLIGAS